MMSKEGIIFFVELFFLFMLGLFSSIMSFVQQNFVIGIWILILTVYALGCAIYIIHRENEE